jgi:uncharacterized membrane protein YcaP (DUF421 family)
VDHSPRLLVSQGKVLDHELQRCGLTLSDVYGLLRQQGVDDLREVRYVIFEQRGQVSVIHRSKQEASDNGLVEDIVGRCHHSLNQRAMESDIVACQVEEGKQN